MTRSKAASKRSYKVGQIVAIPLQEHGFAYGKVFNDFDIGVYDFVSRVIEPLEHVVEHDILFYNSVTDRAVTEGAFIVIGEQPFANEDVAWAPAMAIGIDPEDHSDGVPSIAHKGNVLPATPGQAVGLDIREFHQTPELFVELVVDRLVHGNHRMYRYAP